MSTQSRGEKMTCREIVWGAPSLWIERFPLYYGLEKGLFQSRGVRPELRIFHGGPELLRAVRERRVHVGEIGLPPFIKAFAQGLPACIIGSTFIRQLDHFVVARPGIRTVTDLKGRRIGILSCGSCDEYFLRRLLLAEGIDPDCEVEMVPLGCDYGRLECFSSAMIDAGFMVEPNLSLAENQGICRVILRVGDHFPRYQWGGIFASNIFIESARSTLIHLMEGYRESVLAIAAAPEECVDLGSRVFQMAPDVFRCALKRHLPTFEMDARIDPLGLENCIRIQHELAAIPGCIAATDMVLQM